MGWDAHSSAKLHWGFKGSTYICVFQKQEHSVAFRRAKNKVKKIASGVDGYLWMGALDCSDCGKMLERATGLSAWDENGWNKRMVKSINESANWNFKYPKKDAWAYFSAKIFLETCAKLGLSIKFSY